MCQHGDEVVLHLKTLAAVSHHGKEYWRDWSIDRCIAPIVKALQDAGIDMLGSCCGHGKGDGSILLADGRELVIRKTPGVSCGPKSVHGLLALNADAQSLREVSSRGTTNTMETQMNDVTPLHSNTTFPDGKIRCRYCALDAEDQQPNEGCNGPLPLRNAIEARTAKRTTYICNALKRWTIWFDTYRGPANWDDAELALRQMIVQARVGFDDCVICGMGDGGIRDEVETCRLFDRIARAIGMKVNESTENEDIVKRVEATLGAKQQGSGT